LLTATGFGSKATVELFNILGTKVLSTHLVNGKVELNLAEMKTGIYMVKISEGKQVAVSRLILK
jgi:hypothetical protein